MFLEAATSLRQPLLQCILREAAARFCQERLTQLYSAWDGARAPDPLALHDKSRPTCWSSRSDTSSRRRRTKYERHATKNIENACMFLRVDVSCPWAEKRRE